MNARQGIQTKTRRREIRTPSQTQGMGPSDTQIPRPLPGFWV